MSSNQRNNLRALARYLIESREVLPAANWTVQGFGFLRLRVNPNTRLHIWHSSLRLPDVSDIHDHAQWDFSSRILAGQLVNVRFEESAIAANVPARYRRATIRCGIGGGLVPGSIEDAELTPRTPEVYEVDEHYYQRADEIHRTYAADGTVTLVTQFRKETDTARVFFPAGTEWVDAIPQPATGEDIRRVGAAALALLT